LTIFDFDKFYFKHIVAGRIDQSFFTKSYYNDTTASNGQTILYKSEIIFAILKNMLNLLCDLYQLEYIQNKKNF
jgi:hypothetical protein